jgi:hypothetical protein
MLRIDYLGTDHDWGNRFLIDDRRLLERIGGQGVLVRAPFAVRKGSTDAGQQPGGADPDPGLRHTARVQGLTGRRAGVPPRAAAHSRPPLNWAFDSGA